MTAQELTALRDVVRADVYKAGRRAATLTRAPEGVRFEYLPAWVEQRERAVATTLPVTRSPVVRAGGALPAYFTGLLPEGRRLSALRRQVKTSADDELSLLLAVGADAVGDVQVVPEGVTPTDVPPRLEVADFSAVSFAEILDDLEIRSDRTALPGVQDKVSAAVLSLPLARRGSRFILKLNPAEYPHVVENEAVFLQAARAGGLSAASARVVHDRLGASGLLVERFDRRARVPGGPVVALGMEDGCQVLDRAPADKYLTGCERTFAALVGVCQAPLPAARTLLTQLLFAYLTANGDAHAKNFSVLQDETGEWRPSPAYDVPSSQPYGDTTMALSMGGRTSGDFGGGDFVALGAALGLPERATRKVVVQQVGRVDAWLPLLEGLPFDAGQIRRLRRVVAHRRRRLQQ